MKRCGDCIIYDAEHGWCKGGGDRSPKDRACELFVEADKMVKECCATCRLCMILDRLDYSQGGCHHEIMDGYACLAFADEGQINWMVGLDKYNDHCECYEPKGEE